MLFKVAALLATTAVVRGIVVTSPSSASVWTQDETQVNTIGWNLLPLTDPTPRSVYFSAWLRNYDATMYSPGLNITVAAMVDATAANSYTLPSVAQLKPGGSYQLFLTDPADASLVYCQSTRFFVVPTLADAAAVVSGTVAQSSTAATSSAASSSSAQTTAATTSRATTSSAANTESSSVAPTTTVPSTSSSSVSPSSPSTSRLRSPSQPTSPAYDFLPSTTSSSKTTKTSSSSTPLSIPPSTDVPSTALETSSSTFPISIVSVITFITSTVYSPATSSAAANTPGDAAYLSTPVAAGSFADQKHSGAVAKAASWAQGALALGAAAMLL